MIDKIKVGTAVHSIVPVLSTRVGGGSVENPLRITTDALDENNNYIPGLTIAVGSGLRTDRKGLFVYTQSPLVADDYGLRLRLDGPLETSSNGLTLRIGSGLTTDGGTQLDILLKDPAGPLAINYGLELVIGGDVYTEGRQSQHKSLTGDSYGLHLRLSEHTATPNGERVYFGNAIVPTEYGLTLRIGTNLIVENDTLNVKLSFVTEVSTSTTTSSEARIPGNAIIAIYDGSGDGVGNQGLSLRLHAREIDGKLKPLLTITEGGLDIDIDVLKKVLGLS